MQRSGMLKTLGGLVLVFTGSFALAEPLQPDPAWQEGQLPNGFSWQILATPHRPGDQIELRLVVDTGSLIETSPELGFSGAIPQIALRYSHSFTPETFSAFWQQINATKQTLPPVINSYAYTSYNLSVPNNQPELLKSALLWLSDVAGNLPITDTTVEGLTNLDYTPVTHPIDPQAPWWRYRIQNSTLPGRSPDSKPVFPVSLQALQTFYTNNYTPDVMTLYVAGNVNSRTLGEQINKNFSDLKGKREKPAMIARLSSLPPEPVVLLTPEVQQDRVSLVWDSSWQPIRDSKVLENYWRNDLVREMMFGRFQQQNAKKNNRSLSFDCMAQFQHAECAIHVLTVQKDVKPTVEFLAQILSKLNKEGLTQQEFDAFIALKQQQLEHIFATYARISTDILISQRIRSQQNDVVDISPEEYQKRRRQFLNSLTLAEMNVGIKALISQTPVLVVMQPQGEQEENVKALWQRYLADMSVVGVTTAK